MTRTDEEDWQARAKKATAQLHDALDEQAKLIKERGAARVAGRLALQQRDAEKERAEKAEKERDEAVEALETTLGRAIKAERERDSWESIAQQAARSIEALRAEQPRPLTADDITDEMLYRGLSAYYDIDATQKNWNADRAEDFRRALAAALTEPTRPKGAEKVEAVLHQYWSGDIDGDNLADRIAEEMNR